MPTSNRTEYAILGLLAQGPKSGYDINQVVEERLAHFWHESLGHIYPILKRLRERGWVERRVEEGRAGPPRHEHSLTPEGREALEGWFREPLEPTPPRNELLLRVFLGHLADPADLIRTVSEYRDERARSLERFRGIATMLEAEASGDPELPFWMLTLRAGIRSAEAAVAWCDEALDVLEALEASSRLSVPLNDDPTDREERA